MSKKMRQWVTIVGLFVLLVASGIGYYFVSLHQKNQEQNETEETDDIVLYSMDQSAITEIHLTNTSMDLTLKKKKDQWVDASDEKFPVDQDTVASILSTVAEVKATKLVVEDPEDLSQYELEEPVYQVEIKDQNGQSQTLAIGLESIAAGGCYAYAGTSRKIYTVSSNMTQDLSYTRGQMMSMPEAPDITASYVTGFSLEAKKGKSFEANYGGEKAHFADVDGWDISQPYAMAAGDKEALEGLFEGLSGLEYVEGVEYKTSRKILKQYGLQEPAYQLLIHYDTVEEEDADDESEESEEKKTPHEYQLSIGSKDDTEENYYVCVKGQTGIFKMSVESLDSLVKIDAFDYLSKYIHKANIETIKKISITKQRKTHEITVDKKVDEDAATADGETAYIYTVTLDGKKVDDSAFQDTYASVFGDLTYHGEVSPKKKTSLQDEIRLTIETESRKKEVSFLPYDGTHFYRAEEGGQGDFLVDINAVDNAVKQLLALQ